MAGAGIREYKRRIRSVKNTQQITKAMKMVSAAKLRRAQEAAEASRPYTETLQGTLARLAGVAYDVKHPLLEKREEVRKVGYVVITADRGLCGAHALPLQRPHRAGDDRSALRPGGEACEGPAVMIRRPFFMRQHRLPRGRGAACSSERAPRFGASREDKRS